MNNVINKIKEKPIFYYVIANIVYLLVGNYLTHNLVIDKSIYAYGMSFVLLFFNIIIIFLLRKKYVKNKVDIFLILIGIFSIISTIFAYDKEVALLGVENRYEGLFMIFYYLSLFYIASYVKKEDKRKIIYILLGIGVYQFLYALCQKFNILGVTIYDFKGEIYFCGITDNPNYFAIIMLICLSYSLGLFIDSNEKKMKIIYLLLIIAYTTGLLMSNTLSCVIGLFVVLIYIIIYCIKFKKFKKLAIVFISIIGVATVLHLMNEITLLDDLKLLGNQTKRLTIKHEVSYNMGTGRIYVWKQTLEKASNYIWTGLGVDNFKYVLDGKPIRRYEYYYDKAHNEYLQILVTEGIFCLLSYLMLYLITFIRGVKYSFKNKEVYLILPVIGYLVQAFFNISVINIAPIFFIALAFCLNRNNNGDKNEA